MVRAARLEGCIRSGAAVAALHPRCAGQRPGRGRRLGWYAPLAAHPDTVPGRIRPWACVLCAHATHPPLTFARMQSACTAPASRTARASASPARPGRPPAPACTAWQTPGPAAGAPTSAAGPAGSRARPAACRRPAQHLRPGSRLWHAAARRRPSAPAAHRKHHSTTSSGSAPRRQGSPQSTAHASTRAGARVPRRRVCAHGRGRAHERLGRAHAERSSHSSTAPSAQAATPPGSRHGPGA